MASFEIAGEADGLMRFHADRISVSGTSREEYRESRDSTVKNVMSATTHYAYMMTTSQVMSPLASRLAL